MQVVVEGVGVLGAEVGLDAADGEVHHGQPPGGGVGLLAVDADVAELAAVGFDELLRSARTCRRSRSRGRRRGPCTARASRRAGARRCAACRTGRLSCPRRWRTARGSTRRRGRAMSLERFSPSSPQADGADEVDELAEPLLVEARPGVVLRQHALEARVVALDGDHRVVDDLADGRAAWRWPGGAASAPPSAPRRRSRRGTRPGLRGRRPVFAFACEQLGVLLLEGVGDVLEEDQAEDDVLVLGRVHVVAQLVGRLPELLLEAEVRGGIARR